MIDPEVWEILARRLDEICRLRAEREQPEVKLVFDKHDQARVIQS